jgi:hypothetical protein
VAVMGFGASDALVASDPLGLSDPLSLSDAFVDESVMCEAAGDGAVSADGALTTPQTHLLFGCEWPQRAAVNSREEGVRPRDVHRFAGLRDGEAKNVGAVENGLD